MSSCSILKKDGFHRVHDFMSVLLDYLVIDVLNKNTYGAKKGEANQKQWLSDYGCN